MDIVDAFNDAKDAIFRHVGYKEDWAIIPLDDCRNDFWAVDKFEREWCAFSPNEKALKHNLETGEDDGPGSNELYMDEIYTQRHLPKWVYRGKEFTLVCCDTKTDLNRFLRIFRNDHEVMIPKSHAKT